VRPLKGKLSHATKGNTELKQEVAYLTSHHERTVVSEKLIDDDLSRAEESATKFSVGFERCEDKGGKCAPRFIPISNYHAIQNHPSTETPKPREEAFVCMFYGCAGHLNEFCFRCKRIEKRRLNYARNSYRDEFIDSPPHSYSRVLPRSYSCASPRTSSRALFHFSHGSNYCSYDFGS
jgi:hypothetical protein